MKFLLVFLFSLNAVAQSTVKVSERVAGMISGRHLSQTSPSASITVAAGQWCDVSISMYGLASSGTTSPTARVTSGGNVVFLMGSIPSAVSPYPINAMHSGLKLNAGTYGFDMYGGTWAASSGNLAFSGMCYYK